MNENTSIINRLLKGNIIITERYKYFVITLTIALIHAVNVALFFMNGVEILMKYNIFSSLLYLFFSFVLVKKEKYVFMFGLALFEVLLNSLLSTIYTGWNTGFMIYTIVLIQVIFYTTYTMRGIRKKLRVAGLLSTFVFLVFFFVLAYTRHNDPIAMLNKREMGILFYYNNFLAFAIAFSYSALFIIEIRNMQRKLKLENISLEEQANYDSLTHLLNRNSMYEYFDSTIENALNKNKIFCVFMADIDDFKIVNDTYGHDCGDEVLKNVSAIIKKEVRDGDVVFRWGGEEILVIIKADLKSAKNAAYRICNQVASSSVKYQGKDIKVTITIGVAAYFKGMTADELIKQADIKLYYGKTHGKDQVVA